MTQTQEKNSKFQRQITLKTHTLNHHENSQTKTVTMNIILYTFFFLKSLSSMKDKTKSSSLSKTLVPPKDRRMRE